MFETTGLLRGRAVACVLADSPSAAQATVSVEDLLEHPLVVMRSGYLMHRFLQRALAGRRRRTPTPRTERRWAS